VANRLAEIMKRPLHGIDGLRRTGEEAILEPLAKFFRHASARSVSGPKYFGALEPQFGDGLPILGERASLAVVGIEFVDLRGKLLPDSLPPDLECRRDQALLDRPWLKA